MSVSGKVRAYLGENGMKQKDVAEKANISYAVFKAMMAGHRKIYAEDLCAICYALKVKPELFMETIMSSQAVDSGCAKGGAV